MAEPGRGSVDLRLLLVVASVAAVFGAVYLGWETASWIAAVVGVLLTLYLALRSNPSDVKPVLRPLTRRAAIQSLGRALVGRYDDQRFVVKDPAPVRWEMTSRPVMDDWAQIRDDGLAGPLALAGTFAQIEDTFYRLPRRRLAILGAAGSGKTEIGLLLARRILKAAPDVIPLFLTATAWRVGSETLQEWMIRTLVTDFPPLRAPAGALADEPGTPARTLAEDLVRHRNVMPLIDGLDELPEPLRVRAVRRLTVEGAKLDGFVVLARPEEYEHATTHPEATVLPGTAVIEVRELDDDFVRSSLLRATAPTRRPKWNVLTEQTAAAARLRELLRTPLLLDVVTTVYARTDRDPRELVRYADEDMAAARRLAVGLYIRERYDSPPAGERDVPGGDAALISLQQLAHHLQVIGATGFAWWELDRAVPRSLRAMAMGLLNFAVTFALIVVVERLIIDSVTALQSAAVMAGTTGLTVLVGSAARLSFRPTEPQLRRPTWPELRLGLLVGSGIGLTVGITFALLVGSLADLQIGLRFGAIAGTGVGLLIGIVSAFASGLGTPVELEAAPNPDSTFRNARRGTVLYAVVTGLGAGVPVGVLFWLLDDLAGQAAGRDIPAVSFGITQGLAACVATASTCLFMTAWSRYVFVAVVLARLGWMPRRPLQFALQAERLMLFRRSGAVLEFRHEFFRNWIVQNKAESDVSRRVDVGGRAITPDR